MPKINADGIGIIFKRREFWGFWGSFKQLFHACTSPSMSPHKCHRNLTPPWVLPSWMSPPPRPECFHSWRFPHHESPPMDAVSLTLLPLWKCWHFTHMVNGEPPASVPQGISFSTVDAHKLMRLPPQVIFPFFDCFSVSHVFQKVAWLLCSFYTTAFM